MDALEDSPHFCLNSLILPLPRHMVELLKKKLVTVRILNDFWFQFDQNITSKSEFLKHDPAYVDLVLEARQHLLKYLGRVIELQKSLHLVIPAMQNPSPNVSKLLARINYDCFIFANTLVPRFFVNSETF